MPDKVYGSGVKHVQIIHRSGKANTNADALSRNPLPRSPDASETISEGEIQVAAVRSQNISTLLTDAPARQTEASSFATEQRKDVQLLQLMQFLETGQLPEDGNLAKKVAGQDTQFILVDQTLYFLDPRRNHKKRIVVPTQLRNN